MKRLRVKVGGCMFRASLNRQCLTMSFGGWRFEFLYPQKIQSGRSQPCAIYLLNMNFRNKLRRIWQPAKNVLALLFKTGFTTPAAYICEPGKNNLA
jgi:hypothetical protein